LQKKNLLEKSKLENPNTDLRKSKRKFGKEREEEDTRSLVVVEFETHAIVDLVILQSDVILVDGVPLLDADLVGSGASLSRHKLLQVADCVIIVALHAHLLSQSVVQHHLDHLREANNPNPQIPNPMCIWPTALFLCLGRIYSYVHRLSLRIHQV